MRSTTAGSKQLQMRIPKQNTNTKTRAAHGSRFFPHDGAKQTRWHADTFSNRCCGACAGPSTAHDIGQQMLRRSSKQTSLRLRFARSSPHCQVGRQNSSSALKWTAVAVLLGEAFLSNKTSRDPTLRLCASLPALPSFEDRTSFPFYKNKARKP